MTYNQFVANRLLENVENFELSSAHDRFVSAMVIYHLYIHMFVICVTILVSFIKIDVIHHTISIRVTIMGCIESYLHIRSTTKFEANRDIILLISTFRI